MIDRIKGLIFGQAIGDALGLASEFMTREDVKRFYPKGIRSYKDIIGDRHRGLWQKGAWTDDTDQMLCILDSIIAKETVNLNDIASRFVEWKQTNGIGIGRHTFNVLSIRDYPQHPLEASELIWNMSGKQNAANGGIMRTAILGCWDYLNWEQVKLNTENVCKLTHYDPRCVGSCVVITYIINKCLLNEPVSKADIIRIADQYDSQIAEYIDLAYQESIENLMLDEPRKIGYTLKTMGAALWAYNNSDDFYSALRTVIEQGGDGDTNGAVAGALLGAKFGFNSIPNFLVKGLVGENLLADKAHSFISTIKK